MKSTLIYLFYRIRDNDLLQRCEVMKSVTANLCYPTEKNYFFYLLFPIGIFQPFIIIIEFDYDKLFLVFRNQRVGFTFDYWAEVLDVLTNRL